MSYLHTPKYAISQKIRTSFARPAHKFACGNNSFPGYIPILKIKLSLFDFAFFYPFISLK